MYRVVRASTLYYEKNMRESKSRYSLVLPFLLLTETDKFNLARRDNTDVYTNLVDIVCKMSALYKTGKHIYHHFDMLLRELQVLGFDVENIKAFHITPEERLNEQIDLLLQFLSFRYPFDEYDNRIGVHDPLTNQFIFEQV